VVGRSRFACTANLDVTLDSMTSTALIRIASDSDAAVLRELYRPFVENTAVSFEIEVPTVDEFARRITMAVQTWA